MLKFIVIALLVTPSYAYACRDNKDIVWVDMPKRVRYDVSFLDEYILAQRTAELNKLINQLLSKTEFELGERAYDQVSLDIAFYEWFEYYAKVVSFESEEQAVKRALGLKQGEVQQVAE